MKKVRESLVGFDVRTRMSESSNYKDVKERLLGEEWIQGILKEAILGNYHNLVFTLFYYIEG